MKKEKDMKKEKKSRNIKRDASQLFVKIMALLLAILMVGAVSATLIFYLMH